MKHKFMTNVFLSIFLLVSSVANAHQSFSQVYVFGDSLSDTGNLASIVGPFPSPPFYDNRVSNGPVAVEILAEKLGLPLHTSLHLVGPAVGSNYAIAGANAAGNEGIDLPMQLNIFLANHGYRAPGDALYVIMIGGNDIRGARAAIDKTSAKAIINSAVQQVLFTLDALIQSGARRFLIVNSPNIGIIPETSILSVVNDDPMLARRATKLSRYYRNQLHKYIEQYEDNENIKIIEFDLFKQFNKLIKKSEKYGFTNSTEACFSSITFTFNEGCNFSLNFDQYIFFDEIHPTARVHAIIGNAFYKAVLKDDD